MINRRQKNIISLVFGVFENIKLKNKKIKRILGNLFSRNL